MRYNANDWCNSKGTGDIEVMLVLPFLFLIRS